MALDEPDPGRHVGGIGAQGLATPLGRRASVAAEEVDGGNRYRFMFSWGRPPVPRVMRIATPAGGPRTDRHHHPGPADPVHRPPAAGPRDDSVGNGVAFLPAIDVREVYPGPCGQSRALRSDRPMRTMPSLSGRRGGMREFRPARSTLAGSATRAGIDSMRGQDLLVPWHRSDLIAGGRA
jgi:hypothetical protein